MWNSAVHWARKGCQKKRDRTCAQITDTIMTTSMPRAEASALLQATGAMATKMNGEATTSNNTAAMRETPTTTGEPPATAMALAITAVAAAAAAATGKTVTRTATSATNTSKAATAKTKITSKAATSEIKPESTAATAKTAEHATRIELNMNEVTVTGRKCAVRGTETRVDSPIFTLVEEVNGVGHYIPIALDNNIFIFEEDSGTSVSQISKAHVRTLKRNGANMKLIQKPKVTWKTPTGEVEMRMKLWLIKNVAILGLLESANTEPQDMLMLENPRLRDDDAFLGRSTMMAMRLIVDYFAGTIIAPGNTRIKMWESKQLVERVLDHARTPKATEATEAAAATASTDGTNTTTGPTTKAKDE